MYKDRDYHTHHIYMHKMFLNEAKTVTWTHFKEAVHREDWGAVLSDLKEGARLTEQQDFYKFMRWVLMADKDQGRETEWHELVVLMIQKANCCWLHSRFYENYILDLAVRKESIDIVRLLLEKDTVQHRKEYSRYTIGCVQSLEMAQLLIKHEVGFTLETIKRQVTQLNRIDIVAYLLSIMDDRITSAVLSIAHSCYLPLLRRFFYMPMYLCALHIPRFARKSALRLLNADLLRLLFTFLFRVT